LLNVAQDVTTQSSLFLNQTNQNIATVSPYLMWRLGEKSTLKTGYRYTDTRYWGVGIDQFEHDLFADFNYEWTSKFSLSAGYSFARVESIQASYDSHNVYGGFKYQYADKSSIFGKVGNTWQLFDSGENVNFVVWDVGIIHDMGMAIATLETSSQTSVNPLSVSTNVNTLPVSTNVNTLPVSTNVNPLSVSTKTTTYTGRLDKTLPRGAVGFSGSYLEYENLESVNTQTGLNSQRKLSFSGNGRYEVMDGLVATLAATAERYYGQGVDSTVISTEQSKVTGFRYHLYATSGLSYSLNHDITVSLNYTYEIYQNYVGDGTGAIQINRGILAVRKSF
jgi:uncharacterized protein (PEP-CTERM system associated)